jgi:hypothetical protein
MGTSLIHKSKNLIVITIFYISFFSKIISAQTSNYEFLGSIILANNALYSYKLVFTESKGIIKGYSITDIGGKYETKTKIEGTFNRNSGKLSYTEKQLVYTQYNKSVSNLCYLNVSGKLQRKKNKMELMATYTGTYGQNGKQCDKGRLILLSMKDLYEQLSIAKDIIAKSKPSKNAVDTLLQSLNMLNDVEEVKEISHNSVTNYPWESDVVDLEVWDEGVEDNDMISIKINDSIAYQAFSISKKRQPIRLKLRPNVLNTLKITAVNEGDFAPNTVKVMCKDTRKRYLLLSQLNVNESFIILLDTKK